MPGPATHAMVHRAVLWPRIGTDAEGKAVVSSVGKEIACRWDERRRTVKGPDGEPISVDATALIPDKVRIGSVMWRGAMDDLPGTGQTPEIDVYQVVSYDGVDDWRGRETEHEVGLVLWGHALPAQATDTGPEE